MSNENTFCKTAEYAENGTSCIDFSMERWKKVRQNHHLWWNHKLGRPLIQARLNGRPSPRQPSSVPEEHFVAAIHDFPAEGIVDMWDYRLSKQYFLGDAYPVEWINYGPGVVASFLGCELHFSKQQDTIWFHPKTVEELCDLKFTDTAQPNPYLEKIMELAAAAGKRWGGMVQTGLADLGGTLDVLSSFRPSEGLLYDLYDEPELVEEFCWKIHDRWWDYYDRLSEELLKHGNPGYSCWAPIFSQSRYYMLQCDFCYMLSPQMFEQFVLPELSASCKRLDHAFYHLDGIGQLPSLDLLLSIPELKGVQWIPGDGQPGVAHWPEVHRKISDAGKLIQFFGHGREGMETLEAIADQTGRADNIIAILSAPAEMRSEMEDFLVKWGY